MAQSLDKLIVIEDRTTTLPYDLSFKYLHHFLAMFHGLWDLSTPTRLWTSGWWQWQYRVLTIGLLGNSLKYLHFFFANFILFLYDFTYFSRTVKLTEIIFLIYFHLCISTLHFPPITWWSWSYMFLYTIHIIRQFTKKKKENIVFYCT